MSCLFPILACLFHQAVIFVHLANSYVPSAPCTDQRPGMLKESWNDSVGTCLHRTMGHAILCVRGQSAFPEPPLALKGAGLDNLRAYFHSEELMCGVLSDPCLFFPRTQQGRSGTGPSPRPTTGVPWGLSSCMTLPTRNPSTPCRTGEHSPAPLRLSPEPALMQSPSGPGRNGNNNSGFSDMQSVCNH